MCRLTVEWPFTPVCETRIRPRRRNAIADPQPRGDAGSEWLIVNRVAAQEYSPSRKPWVDAENDGAAGRRKRSSLDKVHACPELAEAPIFEPGPEAVPRCE